MAMQIAALSLDKREDGFSIAERCLQEAVREKGIAGEQIEVFMKIQMDAIRGMVTHIDVSGDPHGGNA